MLLRTSNGHEGATAVLFGVPTFSGARSVLQHAKRDLGEVLSAVEFWDAAAMRLVLSSPVAKARGLVDPLDEVCPFYVLVEAQGSHVQHDGGRG